MTQLARKFEDTPLPQRLRNQELVDAGSLEWLAAGISASPAHALQQRLLQAYVAQGEQAAALPAADEKFALPVRLALIGGLATLCWLPVVAAGVALAHILNG